MKTHRKITFTPAERAVALRDWQRAVADGLTVGPNRPPDGVGGGARIWHETSMDLEAALDLVPWRTWEVHAGGGSPAVAATKLVGPYACVAVSSWQDGGWTCVETDTTAAAASAFAGLIENVLFPAGIANPDRAGADLLLKLASPSEQTCFHRWQRVVTHVVGRFPNGDRQVAVLRRDPVGSEVELAWLGHGDACGAVAHTDPASARTVLDLLVLLWAHAGAVSVEACTARGRAGHGTAGVRRGA